jgi:hypothetical protein
MTAPRITAEEIADWIAWSRRVVETHGDRADARCRVIAQLAAELDRLHADGMPRDREELQKLLNDAYRTGNQDAHEAHRLVQEMGLSAQGGEVPEIQQPNDVDWFKLKRDAEAYVLDWGEGFYQGLAYSNKWLRAHYRPAPPHPDTVEVRAEELGILREGFGLMRTAWNAHALYDYQAVQAERIIQKYDAFRAQPPHQRNEGMMRSPQHPIFQATRSASAIPVTRFHDFEGRPTCCILWGSRSDTCPLLRVSGLKSREVCNWTDERLFRRGDGETGSLIPSPGCPIHPDASDGH